MFFPSFFFRNLKNWVFRDISTKTETFVWKIYETKNRWKVYYENIEWVEERESELGMLCMNDSKYAEVVKHGKARTVNEMKYIFFDCK